MLLGQEIYLFFYKYGVNGIVGILLCNILICYVIFKTLNIVYRNDVENFYEFLNIISPNSRNLNYIINTIMNIFLLFTFFIMVSGFGAYFYQQFQISRIFGAICISIICFFVFLGNINAVKKINSIVIPVLIVIIFIIGINNIKYFNIKNIGINTNIDNSYMWILKAVLYASYNFMILIPVLINLKKFIKKNNDIIKNTIVTSVFITTLSLLIFMLLVNVNVDFDQLEMPIVYVIKNNFYKFSIFYGFIILFAIFSTAASVGLSFLKNICENKKYFPQFSLILCIIAVIISNFGFSNMVKILFPCLGYIGMWIIFLLIIYF